MLDPERIGFRALRMEDMPLMQRWLNTPHVLEWFNEPFTLEETIQHYGSKVTGEDATQPYLVLYGDMPIGYIQSYRISDHPEYAQHVQVEETAAGVDLFIGEVEYVHRGLGPHLLRRFLREVVFAMPGIESCVIGPQPQNRIAIRAYERAGFRYLKTIQVPSEPAPEYLLRIRREELGL